MITVPDNETALQRAERLSKLQFIWADNYQENVRRERAFYQSLLDEECKRKGIKPRKLFE